MEGHVQDTIRHNFVALLQRNAADPHYKRSRSSLGGPQTKREAMSCLLEADPKMTVMDVMDALWILHQRSRAASQTRRWVIRLLLDLGRQEAITANDAIHIATTLYVLSPRGSQERQEAIQRLLTLAERRDIYFGDAVEAAFALYIHSHRKGESEENQRAVQMMQAQARRSDITIAQALEAATALCLDHYRPKERNLGAQAIIELAQRPGLTFEEAAVIHDNGQSQGCNKALRQQEWAAKKQMWEAIVRRDDLTDEQRAQAVKAIADYTRSIEKKRKG